MYAHIHTCVSTNKKASLRPTADRGSLPCDGPGTRLPGPSSFKNLNKLQFRTGSLPAAACSAQRGRLPSGPRVTAGSAPPGSRLAPRLGPQQWGAQPPTSSPPSPPACPSNRRWPAPHWPGSAPPLADWPRSPGPASALAAASILLVEAGGGRVADTGWSAAGSSALVGFVRSVPHFSLEREGGLDVEREPPQSELEVARTSLKLVC